jgi:hypothetical protein
MIGIAQIAVLLRRQDGMTAVLGRTGIATTAVLVRTGTGTGMIGARVRTGTVIAIVTAAIGIGMEDQTVTPAGVPTEAQKEVRIAHPTGRSRNSSVTTRYIGAASVGRKTVVRSASGRHAIANALIEMQIFRMAWPERVTPFGVWVGDVVRLPLRPLSLLDKTRRHFMSSSEVVSSRHFLPRVGK